MMIGREGRQIGYASLCLANAAEGSAASLNQLEILVVKVSIFSRLEKFIVSSVVIPFPWA